MGSIGRELEHAVKHHTHCHNIVLAQEPVVVCELADDFFAHALNIWVDSPRKYAGIGFTCSGKHARDARAECLLRIAAAIADRKGDSW